MSLNGRKKHAAFGADHENLNENRPILSAEKNVAQLLYLLITAVAGQVSVLCLLDLTAAFDTVDNQLLLHRLERQFGVRGVVLTWFSSYLTGRSFRV